MSVQHIRISLVHEGQSHVKGWLVLACCGTCYCAKAIQAQMSFGLHVIPHPSHHIPMAGVSQHCVPCYTNDHFFWMVVGTVWLQEMCVVFVVSMPFTVSLFACAMIDHSGFKNMHSKCTSSTVILLPHLHFSVY